MITGVQVDHELSQGTVQASDRAAQQGEAGTGELGGGFEVQPAMLLAQGDVVLDLEIEASQGAPATNLDVALFIRAHRNGLVGDVGDGQKQAIQFGLDAVEFTLALFQLAAHAVHIGQQRCNVLTALLGLTDGLGAGIALGLQLLGAGLHGLALVFQGFEARHVQLEATGGEALGHVLGLGAYQFGVEHVRFPSIRIWSKSGLPRSQADHPAR